MTDNRRHPGEMNLSAWIPAEIHETFRIKCRRQGLTIRYVLERFVREYTGYQDPPKGTPDGPPPAVNA